jgi:hypothetical protein
MAKYEFTVVLKGEQELTEEMTNALYEAGCDDGSPGSCDGLASINFHREAESLEAAIRSAIADVHKAGYQADNVKIALDSFRPSLATP